MEAQMRAGRRGSRIHVLRRALLLIATAGSLSLSALLASGSSVVYGERSLLVASRTLDRMGLAVAIDGDTAVISTNDASSAVAGGGAYVYVWNGSNWIEQARLSVSGAYNDRFGASLDVSGDRIAVGAPGSDARGTDAGAAYVFVRTGTRWTLEATLHASDAGADDRFGTAVAIDADTVVVGAPNWDWPITVGGIGEDIGAAYVFSRGDAGWTEEAKLTASSHFSGDAFGTAVAVSADTILAGAPFSGIGSFTNAGSAFMFVRDGTHWDEQAQLMGTNMEMDAHFGTSVSIDGDRAVVGAPEFDGIPEFADCGAVYAFARSGTSWSGVEIGGPCGPFSSDHFGTSVGISGTSLVVGAPRDDGPGIDAGRAWIYTLVSGAWNREHEVAGSLVTSWDVFGQAVAMSGNRVIVGAPQGFEFGALNAGSAYAFTFGTVRYTEHARLTGSEGSAGERMGRSVGVSGGYAVVGAWGDDDAGHSSGSAYVFIGGTAWSENSKLVASDASIEDEFGLSVAIDGDTIVVGAPRHDANGEDTGAAYVFTRFGSAWREQARLLASDGAAGDQFGFAVAVYGDSVIVGARFADGSGADAGAAYVFTRSGASWTQQAKLVGGDAAAGDAFGTAVALAEDRAIVGSPGHDAGSTSTGAAYLFDRLGGAWSELAKLVASDGGSPELLGQSVAIGESLVAAGAPGANGGAGAVYAFQQDGGTWIQLARAVASDGAASDSLGWSVAVRGNLVVGGAPLANGFGALYAFAMRATGASQLAKITSPVGQIGEELGFSVAIDGEAMVAGAPGRVVVGPDAGAAHAFFLQYLVTPPIVSAGPDVTINEGTTLPRNVSFSDADDAGPWTASADLGDGTIVGPITVPTQSLLGISHKYVDGPATFTVTVRVRNADLAEGVDSFIVTVRNVGPTVTVNGPTSVGEGGSYDYGFVVADPGLDDFSVSSISCGGGSVVSGSAVSDANGGSFRCRFSDGPASHQIVVTVVDDDGAFGTGVMNVSVLNAPPLVTLNGPASVAEGTDVTYEFTVSDLGADTFVVVGSSCGTGTLVGSVLTTTTGGTFRCRFADGPTSTAVQVTVADDDGANRTAEIPVMVTNAPPSVALSGPPAIVEGGTYSYTFTVSDPGVDTLSVAAADVSCGANGTVVPGSLSYASGAGGMSCSFGDGPAMSVVSVTARDEDGASGTATLPVSIANAIPIANAGGDVDIGEGSALERSGSIADFGGDTWTATVDYGLGAGPERLDLAGRAFRLFRDYPDDGTYTVRVVVTDDDGGVGGAVFRVRVLNIAPSIQTLRAATSGLDVLLVGVALDITAEFTDPGPLDTHSAMVNWDDGSATQALGPVKSPLVASHTYARPGKYLVVLTVVDDDRGVGSATIQITVLDPAGAVHDAADEIGDILSDPTADPAVVAAIEDALRALEGNSGANNGAATKLEDGDLNAGLQKIEQALRSLEDAEAADPGLDLDSAKAALALTARAVATNALAVAEAAANTPAELDLVDRARAELADGNARFAAGDYLGAVNAYQRSVRASLQVN